MKYIKILSVAQPRCWKVSGILGHSSTRSISHRIFVTTYIQMSHVPMMKFTMFWCNQTSSSQLFIWTWESTVLQVLTQSCEMSVRQERNCSFEMHFWIKFKFKPMWYEILEAKWVFQVEIFNVIYSFFYLWKQSNVQILVICDHNNLLVFCKMWFGQSSLILSKWARKVVWRTCFN